MKKKLEQTIFNAIIEDDIDSFKNLYKQNSFDLNHIFGDINTEDGLNSEYFNIIFLAIDWHSLKILNFILKFPELEVSGNKNVFKNKISPFSLFLLRGMKDKITISNFINRDDFDLFEKDLDNKDFRHYLDNPSLAQEITHEYNKKRFKSNLI